MSDEIIIETTSAEVIEVGTPGPQGPQGAAGTGLETLTTQGDTLYRGASTGQRLPIGTAGQILKVSAGGIPEWGAESGAVSSVAGRTGAVTLAVADVSGAVSTSDARLSDSRTPSSTLAHSSTHHTGGADAIAPSSIGAAASGAITSSGLTSTGQSRIIGRITAGTGALEEIGVSSPLTFSSGNLGLLSGVIPTASTATPSALGTAAAGTSSNFTRADHVHAMPTAADVGAAGASHTHAASAITSGILDNARINFAAPPAIGNTTPAAGTFTTLSATPASGSALTLTGGTVTASAPLIDATQTWNNAAVTFTGLRFNVTNTASAAGSLYESIQLAGDQFYELAGSRAVRLYNTSSSSNANYERGFMRWSSNVLQIGTEKLGTGTARNLEFQTDGVTRLTIGTDGNAGFAGSITANNVIGQSGAVFLWSTRSRMYSDADGRIRISNNAQNDFDRLQFGGTTTSFPALKRSSTTLQVRLADDSAFAPFACAGLTLNGDLTASTRNIVTDTTTGTKIGTGTTQLLGFWNATPVAQQSSTGTNATGFTANGPGNTVHADSTFTGNVGATAYSISDIVKHLKTIGLIAS